jgi:hypothetical protein
MATRNHYWLRGPEGDQWTPIHPEGSWNLGWGKDYYSKVLRIIESNSRLAGLTFYLSKATPESLPSYGRNVVLLAIGDEYYRCFPYFLDIRAVIRCYGSVPSYLDGLPTDLLKITAFLQFLFKLSGYLKDLWRSTKFRKSLRNDIQRRTFRVPLGCFGEFDVDAVEFSSRTIDYAFLGSVEYDNHPRYSLRGIIRPPKISARTQMTRALREFSATRKCRNGTISVSQDFLDSISKQDSYVEAMANCKISICPRGTNYETYRFNESCKAGCVIICEPIPKAWYHDNHPGITIEDWRKLPDLLDSLLKDPSELLRLANASRPFWASHMAEDVVANRIESFLLGL